MTIATGEAKRNPWKQPRTTFASWSDAVNQFPTSQPRAGPTQCPKANS